MTKRALLTIAAMLSLAPAAPAPAGTKPCRDKDGKVVPCPKPPRKPVQRCKDEKGRFVACPTKDQPASR